MAEANGNGKNPLDRVDEILAALLEHARVTDEHQDRQDRAMEELTQSLAITNDVVRNLSAQTESMLGALLKLIDASRRKIRGSCAGCGL